MAAMTQSPPVTTPVESTRTESFTLASSAYQSLKSLRNEGAHYKVIGSFLNSAEFVATRSVEVTSKYTKVNSLAEIDAAVAPALDKLDKRATPVISTTLKVTEEKIATPLAPLVKYFAKFLPVKTTEKAGVWALAVFMKNLEKLQNMLLIKEETPESE